MASKSKKRRRVLGASCILAALIIAGSSFAWFTSKDEVTNRLSANADYDVKIVESFGPPENWLPGQEVNKDEYATNTGSIAAFVEQKVSGRLAITKEEKVAATQNKAGTPEVSTGVVSALPTEDLNNQLVRLDVNERYSIEAGSFLAYAPNGSTNEVGRQIVVYKPTFKYYKISDKDAPAIDQTTYDALTAEQKKDYVAANASTTDFQPSTEGLYVFRRVIDVADDRSEKFEYVGYYYKDGQYYEVADLAVTPDDVRDLANDGVDSDGVLKSAEFSFVKEVKDVATPTLTYDSENNRLVATYGVAGTTYVMGADSDDVTADTLKGKAKALDKADHELAEARAQLDQAILDVASTSADVQKYMDKVSQLEAEKAAVEARIQELKNSTYPTKKGALDAINDRVSDLEKDANTAGSVLNAEKVAKDALKKLYGDAHETDYNPTTGAITFNEKLHDVYTGTGANYTDGAYGASDSSYLALLKAKKNLDDAKSDYDDSTFRAYARELVTALGLTATYPLDTLTYEQVIADPAVTYAYLTGATSPKFSALTDPELHDINERTIQLLAAQEQYDKDKDAAEDKLADYINKKNELGTVGTASTSASYNETIAGETVTYTKVTPVNDGSGLKKQQKVLQAEYDTLTSDTNDPKGKLQALNAKIAALRESATNAATVTGSTTGTAQATLETAKTNYKNKENAYYTALNNYNKYLDAYNEQNKQLIIYVNLADVVTTTGEADKWQLLPVPASTTTPPYHFADDTAVFYYTGILESGETSSKLIDSVELDKNTTQNMYKSFDFDLNMELKSAQITYADDNVTIKTDAAVDELDATPTLYEPTNIGTAVAWS